MKKELYDRNRVNVLIQKQYMFGCYDCDHEPDCELKQKFVDGIWRSVSIRKCFSELRKWLKNEKI